MPFEIKINLSTYLFVTGHPLSHCETGVIHAGFTPEKGLPTHGDYSKISFIY